MNRHVCLYANISTFIYIFFASYIQKEAAAAAAAAAPTAAPTAATAATAATGILAGVSVYQRVLVRASMHCCVI